MSRRSSADEQVELDPDQEAAVNNYAASLHASVRKKQQMERRGQLYQGGWCGSARRFASIAQEIVRTAKLASGILPSTGLIHRVHLSFYDKRTGTTLRRFVVPARSIIRKVAQGEVVVTYPTGEQLFIDVTSGVIKLLRTAGFPASGRATHKRLGYGPDGRWGSFLTD